jgi:hypothetical protein
VAGVFNGEAYALTKSGERDYFQSASFALLWVNDAPPKVLKGTNDRYATSGSVFVEDGDVYVCGTEHEFSRTSRIWRDVMWKNDEPAVPIGPERVIFGDFSKGQDKYERESEDDSPASVVSDGDAYAASKATVLKNGRSLFTVKPKAEGASCTVQSIIVVK